ncbi:MAG: hypothetical protein Q9203_006424 [Teloschistes exilis]
MTSPEKLVSSSRPRLDIGYSTPVRYIPSTPPSTEASSPYPSLYPCPPQEKDLTYVIQRLWSGSHRYTPRFSYENPIWPDEEEYLLGSPSNPFLMQDDDATMVSNSGRTDSRCSQTTVCGSLSSDEKAHSSSQAQKYDIHPPELLQASYQKGLPSPPTEDRLQSLAGREEAHMKLGKCSHAGSSASGSICTSQVSSPIRATLGISLGTTGNYRINSWPTFAAQREATSPPLLEEKSGWDDSDSDVEAGEHRLGRFRRRVSNRLRVFLCTGRPRRQSA